ncbi:MAG: mercuric reductase [Candidatus Longimicrobiales bacterium M2_2A_002]
MNGIDRYDAIIVGTGQGGKPLAGALAEADLRTAIIEKNDRVGGTCVLTGCTPTKTMAASARIAHLARRAEDYGVETGDVRIDMARVRERKRDIVEQWSEGSRKGLERHDDLDLIRGTARFTAPHTMEVADDDGQVTHRLAADRIFLNVGGRPRIPTIDGLDDVDYLTSATIMELDYAPDHLIILGGGFIGLEFGQMFRRFGSDVTIIEAGPRIAGREDEDVSEAITEILRDEGITIRTDATATAARRPDANRPAANRVELTVETEDAEETIAGTELLVAVGRRSNADLLNLEAAGLETDDRGHIPVDDRRRTEVNGIWALGDVTGAPPFTHTAYDDYRVIKNNILGDGTLTTAGRVLTYAVFTDPQLGRVGMTEALAEEQGHEVRIAKLPMSRVARAMEMDETRGFMKAIVDARSGQILGAAILGIEGGEIASAVKLAMMGRLPYTALRDAVLPHPTLAESLNNLFMTLD